MNNKQDKSAVILVFNNKGELALQLRSATDSKYPLHWDFSAAGGIEEGEDPKEAAVRELKEEIGVEAELEFVDEIMYQDSKGQDYLHIYKTSYNGDFEPDGIEVEKVEWFSLNQIEKMLESGEKFHPEFPFLYEKGMILRAAIKRSPLSTDQQNKTDKDLSFIDLLSKFAKSLDCRTLVAGGYSADAHLGQITRAHNDIDIQVYGNHDNPVEVMRQLSEKLGQKFEDLHIEDKKRKKFSHAFVFRNPSVYADVTYIQVEGDPFSDRKVVIKDDGTKTEEHPYNSSKTKLQDVELEATDPTFELADIIYKRDHRGDKQYVKHEQDIYNLSLITDSREMNKLIEAMKSKK